MNGYAVVAGRKGEAETRLSAAETAFGRAMEKDPARWECYFAFAQTQFRYGRYANVVELCRHMLALRHGWADEAKVQELLARALLEQNPADAEPEDLTGDASDRFRDAVEHSMRGGRLALRSLARARLRGRPSRGGESDPESRCAELATACLLTFTDIYSRQIGVVADSESKRARFRRPDRIRRRLHWLVKLAPMTQGKAELRFKIGMRALRKGHHVLAQEELKAAMSSDPTRPSYCAGLALVRTRLLKSKKQPKIEDREPIIQLCLQALQGMAGAFFPSRDREAIGLASEVYDLVGAIYDGAESAGVNDDHKTSQQLLQVDKEVDQRLKQSVSGASVSGTFLEVLREINRPLSFKIGEYGETAQRASALRCEGAKLSEQGRRAKALTRFRDALSCAERATSLNPLSALAWETLGDVHRELSDFQSARSAWQQALGFDPDNPRLYDKIGSSYWHIAFEGRTKASREDLKQADEHFNNALSLYRSGSNEHLLTHYRLGKLNAALREFEKARRHLDIVEAADGLPMVGWGFLGFAYLERRNFAECEYYFGRTVREGERLRSKRVDLIIGDRLDEQLWPLGLIRAWGHLGLAMSIAERDGDHAKARTHIDGAQQLLEKLELDQQDPSRDERFPTRAMAAVAECRGLILLREGKTDEAIVTLEDAVRQFPHSRSYIELALALEQRAIVNTHSRRQIIPRANRLLEHAVILAQRDEPPDEVKEAMQRLTRLRRTGGQPSAPPGS